MNRDERFLYLLASRLEFEALCRRIVHDGRDPFWVSESMLEKLAEAIDYYQTLWTTATSTVARTTITARSNIMNAKHTPGPWHICEHGDFWDIEAHPCGYGYVARLDRSAPGADASLIASAPDLLEACYAALASGPMLRGATDRTADENALHETLWAAIRKATGEEE